MYTM